MSMLGKLKKLRAVYMEADEYMNYPDCMLARCLCGLSSESMVALSLSEINGGDASIVEEIRRMEKLTFLSVSFFNWNGNSPVPSLFLRRTGRNRRAAFDGLVRLCLRLEGWEMETWRVLEGIPCDCPNLRWLSLIIHGDVPGLLGVLQGLRGLEVFCLIVAGGKRASTG
jgi:hypothetical protein